MRRKGNIPVSLTAKQKLIENSRKFLEHHRHVIEKMARIAGAKKKAKEDMIDEMKFEAALGRVKLMFIT